jgi:16S rRNA (guanine966-N2)-methyltransferase
MNQRRQHAAPGHVRIIGGRWRGTRLPVAQAPGLRPTSDRVRETLFNWLQPCLPGARVLDLFAGSGALGLEALSRGAREAVLVETMPDLVGNLRGVVERLGAQEEATVVQADAIAWLKVPVQGRFDVVFVDPPFDSALWSRVLSLLAPWLADDALVYLEAPADAAPSPDSAWTLHRDGRTRDVHYSLYRRAATLGPGSRADGAATA